MGTVGHTALVQAISDSSSSLSGRPSLRRPLQRTPEFLWGSLPQWQGLGMWFQVMGVRVRLQFCD